MFLFVESMFSVSSYFAGETSDYQLVTVPMPHGMEVSLEGLGLSTDGIIPLFLFISGSMTNISIIYEDDYVALYLDDDILVS